MAGRPSLATPEIKGDLRLVTDGAAAQEGAQWDAPVAVTFDSKTASITYDLGAPHSISALFVQADANDTYKILGSLDDTSASYHVIADVPNVVDRGHGLRNRALEIAPTTVRYLRFGDGDGDGFFSLSELAAYCQKPVPFPPGLRTVDAAPAVVTDSAPAVTPPPSDGGRSVLLIAAALLGIAWFGSRLFSRAAAGSTPCPGRGRGGDGGGRSPRRRLEPNTAA